MYFIKVMENSFNKSFFYKKEAYRHFESIEGMFYNLNHKYKLSSTNGFAIETARLSDDFRISRFVRDPRDLVVSGYFYHKRGAEPWFRMDNPTEKYWSPINGHVPKKHPKDSSFADYLSEISIEEGLFAELEFRQYQIESYRNWETDERIKCFKYEEILDNEVAIFSELADHLLLSKAEKAKVLRYAKQFAYHQQPKKGHIRNPKPSQWKEYFTPDLIHYFNDKYGDILDQYKYL